MNKGLTACRMGALGLAGVLLFLSGCGKTAWLDRRDRGQAMVKRAEARKQEGDIEGAITLFRQALDMDPALAAPHLDLALALHERADKETAPNDHMRAIYHYSRYLDLRPETEKRELIEDRIRLASQSFAANVFRRERAGPDASRLVEEENARLRKRLREVETELEALRATQTAIATTATTTTVPRPRTYRVKKGDNLTSIAQEVYGDGTQAVKLFNANRDTLRNMNDVRAGQVLKVP